MFKYKQLTTADPDVGGDICSNTNSWQRLIWMLEGRCVQKQTADKQLIRILAGRCVQALVLRQALDGTEAKSLLDEKEHWGTRRSDSGYLLCTYQWIPID